MTVLIVGGGPVGLVLGCELRRRGVQVRLVDAERRFTRHSRANVLWPRILELLDRLQVGPALAERGHAVGGVGYFSAGRRIGDVRVDAPYSAHRHALVISQNDTEEVLRARFAELGGHVESGVRLTALTEAPAAVSATLTHVDGTTEQVEVDWLVGADGAHSPTREMLGIPFEGDLVDVSFAVADAPLTGAPPEDMTYYCYSPEGGLALGPFGGGVWRLAITVPHSPDGAPPAREVFQQALDDRAPGSPRLGELRWSAVFRARCRIAARFRQNRCLLAGDAAHVLSPAGGQGMNTGIQDAVNLGWRLAGVVLGELDERVLDHYAEERLAAARAVAATTTAQTKWGMVSGPWQVGLRDALFTLAHRSGLLRTAVAPIVSQLGVDYRGTGAVRGRRGGRRLPVPLGGGPGALHPDRPTVLVWGGLFGSRTAPDVLRGAVADRAAVLTDPATPRRVLLRALGPRPALVVLRPDGHITACTRPGDRTGLRAALELAAPTPTAIKIEGSTPWTARRETAPDSGAVR
ncbi:FAD-dependent monooxygenase [Saccharothrix sp. S26]|uniref:FAD-dependent monooxygenase n=1 Tax=Saccharothrix sp. S26 TaxID=2907215 RepID=UPI001F2E5715|nr:FAD-dependent monooxygenase [Saccharothrix sp. S26]MCE6996345.1 FAD-dependent monooxygenase [Saccharothrix sp. S26]